MNYILYAKYVEVWINQITGSTNRSCIKVATIIEVLMKIGWEDHFVNWLPYQKIFRCNFLAERFVDTI